MSVPAGTDWVALIDGIGSLEEQIGLTVAVLLVAVLLGRYIAPGLVDWTRLVLDRAAEVDVLSSWVERAGILFPWWISGTIVTRLLQVLVFAVTVLALLVIWGQLDLAVAILGLASVSAPTVAQVAVTVLLFLLAYVSIDLLGDWLRGLTARSEQFSRHQEEIALRVLQLVVLTGVSLVALSLWGVDLGGLLIGAGFLGIVAGLAAQQTLGSLIAGFVLMFSRPFEIGDWVEIGDNEGIITEITIVNTRLENFDGEFIVLPNDVVGNSTIINRSKKGRLRIRVEVGIDYDADPEHAQAVAIEAIKEVDQILTVPRPQAFTRRLADSSVVLELRFWIDKPSARRRAKATSAAIRSVKTAFDEDGIKIPFPQRELSDRPESGGFRVLDSSPGDDD